MTQIVYVNGTFLPANEAQISIFDRGLLFADSVYEVMPVYDGRAAFVENHLDRLQSNLQKIKMQVNDVNWHNMFDKLISENGAGDMQIYWQVTRGNTGQRKHDLPTNLKPSIIAFTLHNTYPSWAAKEKGMRAQLVEDNRWLRCDIKTTALISNVLLNDEAVCAGAETALLHRNGLVNEGAATNVFIVNQQDEVVTPPLNNLILPGITRQITLDLLRANQFKVREANVTVDDLLQAKEVWVTSTTKEIFPVTCVDQQTIGNGKGGTIWQQIEKHYQQLVRKTHG